MAKIGVDVDGVLYDFVQALIDYAEHTHGYENLPYAESWNFYEKQWGWSGDQFLDIYTKGVHDWVMWSNGIPMGDCKTWLNKLYDEGHEIHVVTWRSLPKVSAELGHQITKDWFERHGLKYHSITVARDKTCVPVDYFIEDNVDNYLSLKECGTTPVLINRPWNQYLENATRVDNWEEFYLLINTLENTKCSVHREIPDITSGMVKESS